MTCKCMIDIFIACFILISLSMCGKSRTTLRQEKSKVKTKNTTTQPVKKSEKLTKPKEPAPKPIVGLQPTREDEGVEQTLSEKKKTEKSVRNSPKKSSVSAILRSPSEKRSQRSPGASSKRLNLVKALAPPENKQTECKDLTERRRREPSTTDSSEVSEREKATEQSERSKRSERSERSERKKTVKKGSDSTENTEKTITKTEEED